MRSGRSVIRRAVVVGAVGTFLVALLGGCGPISATIDTEQALTNAGYQSVSVNFSVGNGDEVKVGVHVNAPPSQTNSDDVARIVWQKFHERFAVLAVTVHGTAPAFQRGYSRADLVSMFGPRNPAYDKTSVTSATERLGLIVIIVVVLLIASAVLIVVLVRRGRRDRQRPPWSPGGPPWMPGGQPSGGPAPPWMQGGPSAHPYPQQPAGYPTWPSQPVPQPDRPPESEPSGNSSGGNQAPAWPPAPPPPTGD